MTSQIGSVATAIARPVDVEVLVLHGQIRGPATERYVYIEPMAEAQLIAGRARH